MFFKTNLRILLLGLTVMLSFLCACDAGNGDDTVIEPAEDVPVLVFADNGKTNFSVIRAEEPDIYTFETAVAVYKKLKNTYSGDFSLTDDWLGPNANPAETGYELLLFETARAESNAAMEDLAAADAAYVIRVTDEKIVVVGATPSASNEALNCFFDLLEQYTQNGVTALPVGLEITAGKSDVKEPDVGALLAAGRTVHASFLDVFDYPYPRTDGFLDSQGAASDGSYVYFIMKKADGDREVDRIFKIDMQTWEIVAESEVLPLDHANDMTYDAQTHTHTLVVTNMYEHIVTLIDPDTLTVKETQTLPYGTYGVGYVGGDMPFFFLGYDGENGLVMTDRSFDAMRTTPLASAEGFTGQGMDADSRYAYVPLSPGTEAYNKIQIYSLSDGEHLGDVMLDTTMESETIFHVGEDFYIQFNHNGSKIARLMFYEPFA